MLDNKIKEKVLSGIDKKVNNVERELKRTEDKHYRRNLLKYWNDLIEERKKVEHQ